MFGFLAVSYDFLHWSKILYEFLMNDITPWGPQNVMREPQKDD